MKSQNKINRKISILQISLDKNLSDINSDTFERQRIYSEELLFNIIFVLYNGRIKQKNNLIIHFMPYYLPKLLFPIYILFKIGQYKEKFKIDLITTQDPLATGLIGLSASKLYKIKLEIQHHSPFIGNNYWVNENPINKIWRKIAIFTSKQGCNRVVSPQIKKLIVKNNISKNIYVNPVRPQLNKNKNFNVILAEKETRILSNNHIRICWVSRFVKFKNPSLMLKIIEDLSRQNIKSKIEITILGAGELKNSTLSNTNIHILENEMFTVRFTNYEKDIGEFLNKQDIIFHTSNYEGWGRVIPESISHLVVPITTKIGANYYINSGVNGYVIENDPKKFVQKIKYLINNVDVLIKFQKNLVEVAIELQNQFDDKRVIENYITYWKKCVFSHQFNL